MRCEDPSGAGEAVGGACPECGLGDAASGACGCGAGHREAYAVRCDPSRNPLLRPAMSSPSEAKNFFKPLVRGGYGGSILRLQSVLRGRSELLRGRYLVLRAGSAPARRPMGAAGIIATADGAAATGRDVTAVAYF